MHLENLDIIIENPKGSYKSFETEGDPVWRDYPLKGVTYPVDYGYIRGYKGEDGANLDVFFGTGELCGFVVVWRLDVPEETKMFINVTQGELSLILEAFKPVLLSHRVLSEFDFIEKIAYFRK
jgi:hypothetical protein